VDRVPSRSLIVVIATALGVVGAIAAYSAVQSAPARAYHNTPLASVYLVRAAVPRDETPGTAFDQGLIVSAQMPQKYVPAGAVTNLGDLRGQVTGSALIAGEVVVRDMFVPAAENPGAAAQTIPAGDVAVSVAVAPDAGVGGAVQPGDDVDLLVDVQGTEEAYLYRAVPVLAVGTKLVPTPGTSPSATPVAVISLAMSPADAAHIPPTTSQSGPITQGVYLALDGPGTEGTSVTPISLDNLIPGVNLSPQSPTPAGSGGASTPGAPGRTTSPFGGSNAIVP
jgi:pilus assembly protein CpaB